MKCEIRENIPYEDFAFVFRTVFEGAPYFEDWSDEEEMKAEYASSKTGHQAGYYVDDRCVGLMIFRPMIVGEHPVSYPQGTKGVYISDVAVLPDYRRNGIGSMLFDYALKVSKEEGYGIAYMRTLPKGQSMSYNIATRLGMSLMKDVIQPTFKARNLAERANVDQRIFLDVNLKFWG